MIRRAYFAAVYAALHAAHDVGDHILQTDTQAAHKTREHTWQGPLAGHVLTYTAAQLAALAAIGARPSWRLAAGVGFSAASHAFIDRRWPVLAVMRATGSVPFSHAKIPAVPVVRTANRGPATWQTTAQPLPLHGAYLADQAMHHACLFISALIIAGGRS